MTRVRRWRSSIAVGWSPDGRKSDTTSNGVDWRCRSVTLEGSGGAETYRCCMRPVTDLQRQSTPFEVVSDFRPSGDQPTAIEDLQRRILAGEKDVVLLGATGTGKSATTAWLIERLQRPTC